MPGWRCHDNAERVSHDAMLLFFMQRSWTLAWGQKQTVLKTRQHGTCRSEERAGTKYDLNISVELSHRFSSCFRPVSSTACKVAQNLPLHPSFSHASDEAVGVAFNILAGLVRSHPGRPAEHPTATGWDEELLDRAACDRGRGLADLNRHCMDKRPED